MTTPDLPPLRTAAEVLSDLTIDELLAENPGPRPTTWDATQLSIAEVTHYLLSNIGQRVSTVSVGLRNARTLLDWQQGKAEPDELTAVKLRIIAQATALIALRYGYEPGKGCMVAISYLRSSNFEVPPGVDAAPVIAVGEAPDLEILTHVGRRLMVNVGRMMRGDFAGPDTSKYVPHAQTGDRYLAEPLPRWLSFEYGLATRALVATAATAATGAARSNDFRARDTLVELAGEAAGAVATFKAFPGTRTALGAIVRLASLLDTYPGLAGAAPLHQLLRDSAHDPAVRATVETMLSMASTPGSLAHLKAAKTAAWASQTPTNSPPPPAGGIQQRTDIKRGAAGLN